MRTPPPHWGSPEILINEDLLVKEVHFVFNMVGCAPWRHILFPTEKGEANHPHVPQVVPTDCRFIFVTQAGRDL